MNERQLRWLEEAEEVAAEVEVAEEFRFFGFWELAEEESFLWAIGAALEWREREHAEWVATHPAAEWYWQHGLGNVSEDLTDSWFERV